MNNNNIDFVIPWVNSNDSKWASKLSQYDLGNLKSENVDGDSEERFRDYDTLKFLLRSIDKFAPWVHRVFLVTDKQIPDWLNINYSKVEIVDHTDIIDAKFLPTFNSNAIEFSFDKIPNLSDNFVAFNDDFLINRSVKPDDFFSNGIPRDFRIYTPLLPLDSFDVMQFNNILAINEWLDKKWPLTKNGFFSTKYGKSQIHNFIHILTKQKISNYMLSHNALSINKISYIKAKQIWHKQIINTISHRFRSNSDVTIWLVRYLQLETGNFRPRSPHFSRYFTLNDHEQIFSELSHPKHYLICINDSNTKDYVKVTKLLHNKLLTRFPNKSKFEM